MPDPDLTPLVNPQKKLGGLDSVWYNPSHLVHARSGLETIHPIGEPVPSLTQLPWRAGSHSRYTLRLLPGPSIEQRLRVLSTRLDLGFSLGLQFDELAYVVLLVQRMLHAWQRAYHAHKHERRVVYHSEA